MCSNPVIEIPFDVRREDNRNLRLFVYVTIEFEHPGSHKVVSQEIEFQIDTGADSTTLFNSQMELLAQIGVSYADLRKLPEDDWSRGILGERLPTYSLRNVALVFKTAQGQKHCEKLRSLRAVEIPQRENNDPFACPALLGMGLLERFDIHFDGPGETAVARKA